MSNYTGSGSKARAGFDILRRVVKALALLVGGTGAFVAVVVLAHPLVESLWIRMGIVAVVLVLVPLVASEPLLPKEDPSRGKGLPTDLMAVTWMAIVLSLTALARPALANEAAAHRAEHLWLAAAVTVLAPVQDAETTTDDTARAQATPVPLDAGAPKPDAGLELAPAKADAPDGGAPPAVASEDLTPAELFQRWAPSVVSIHAGVGGGGTGFVLDDDGLVATNSHVVHEAHRVSVKLIDGAWADRVELLLDDEENDLALLRIETESALVPVVLGESEGVTVGERAISIGNPLGLEHTLTDGVVSARRVYHGRPMIQMSTPVSPGNSGGPLFNARGEVIGVTTAQVGGMFVRAQNLNLAVPVDVLKDQISADHPPARDVGGGPPHGAGRW